MTIILLDQKKRRRWDEFLSLERELIPSDPLATRHSGTHANRFWSLFYLFRHERDASMNTKVY